jgi:hypothetical protein
MTEQESVLFKDSLRPNMNMERVEELCTLNLFFLAQVYGHMGLSDKSAEYCQLCLERQLENFEVLNLVVSQLLFDIVWVFCIELLDFFFYFYILYFIFSSAGFCIQLHWAISVPRRMRELSSG